MRATKRKRERRRLVACSIIMGSDLPFIGDRTVRFQDPGREDDDPEVSSICDQSAVGVIMLGSISLT